MLAKECRKKHCRERSALIALAGKVLQLAMRSRKRSNPNPGRVIRELLIARVHETS